MISDVGDLFMFLLAICIFSLENVYSGLLPIFKSADFFFISSYMGYLYILDINLLLVISLSNIFPSSIDYLLILLVVSFAVQKF